MTKKIVALHRKGKAPLRASYPGSKAVDRSSVSSSLVPLMRCSWDPNSCPASGSIVALTGPSDRYACIVCGRSLRFASIDQREGQVLARIPSHRRADANEIAESRVRTARMTCKLEQEEKAARDALSRRAPARARRALQRAWKIAGHLPENDRLTHRLNRLEARLISMRTKAQLRKARMPRDAKRLLAEIVNASGFDVTAVEPDGFIEHLSSALPQRALIPIAKLPAPKWIMRGLEVLLRRAAPKTWSDLEERDFAGQRSVMAFIREFPGLEGLRLPDRGYEASVLAELADADIPF